MAARHSGAKLCNEVRSVLSFPQLLVWSRICTAAGYLIVTRLGGCVSRQPAPDDVSSFSPNVSRAEASIHVDLVNKLSFYCLKENQRDGTHHQFEANKEKAAAKSPSESSKKGQVCISFTECVDLCGEEKKTAVVLGLMASRKRRRSQERKAKLLFSWTSETCWPSLRSVTSLRNPDKTPSRSSQVSDGQRPSARVS